MPTTSSTSGINAIAYAVEALYAQERNPIILLMAEEGIATLARALPKIVADSKHREGRSDALYGAWLCGTCLGAVGMAFHHKLCHTLGGAFDLPHAETHAIVLGGGFGGKAYVWPHTLMAASRRLRSARERGGGLEGTGSKDDTGGGQREEAKARNSPIWLAFLDRTPGGTLSVAHRARRPGTGAPLS
jgi:maleylacetate reductase